MRGAEEERFLFLRFADGDISHALMVLDCLPSMNDEFIRNCLLSDAVVAFIRPFKFCKVGRSKEQLPARYVPRELRPLHKELVAFRDEVFAHTDITVRAAVLRRLPVGFRSSFGIQFKTHTYPTVLARVDKLRDLFEAVLANVREELSELEEKLKSATD